MAPLRFDVDPDARADAWVTFDGRSRVCLKRGDSLIVTASPPVTYGTAAGEHGGLDGGLRTHFNFNVAGDGNRRCLSSSKIR